MYHYSKSRRERERMTALAAFSFTGLVVIGLALAAGLSQIEAFQEGRRAAEFSRPVELNPYDGRDVVQAESWRDGWRTKKLHP
jgi:hypothetical protein